MRRLRGYPVEVRFDSHVNKSGGDASPLSVKHYPELEGTQCWIWMNVDKRRHPAFWNGQKYIRAHRFALELHLGREVPSSLEVCHKCDNPICVNPIHLFEGTHKKNMEDRNSKGRQGCGRTGPKNPLKGEDNKRSKLNEESVRYIRANYSRGKQNGTELAKQFGVSHVLIYKIVKGGIWKHLEEGSCK